MTGASERYVRAVRAWHDAGIPVADVDPTRDARIVATLRWAIRRVPERTAQRRRRHAMLALALAAMTALAAAAVFRLHMTSAPAALRFPTLQAEAAAALVLRHGTTRFADPSSVFRLEGGDEVSVASGGRAHVRLASGALVEISAATRVRIGGFDRDEAITLEHGTVALRVPKLASPHTLSVVAPDASVIVHGTQFSVAVDGLPPAPTRTSVHVTQGEVAVLFPAGHVILRSGQSWSSGHEPPSIDDPLPPSSADAVPGADDPQVDMPTVADSSRGGTTVAPKAGPARSSKSKVSEDLAIQNRLYSAALSARDRGDDERAVSLLSELLDRYPSSPLADEARRVRARASSQLHDRR